MVLKMLVMRYKKLMSRVYDIMCSLSNSTNVYRNEITDKHGQYSIKVKYKYN